MWKGPQALGLDRDTHSVSMKLSMQFSRLED
jgi:hypothetical protein